MTQNKQRGKINMKDKEAIMYFNNMFGGESSFIDNNEEFEEDID